jgi:hypothetical protein
MAVKRSKKAKRKVLRIYHAVKGGTHRLRKKPRDTSPTPPEISAPDTRPTAGILRVDADAYHLPEAFVEAGETESNDGLLPGRVMLTITLLAIVFIAIMTWFVSQMPRK